LPQPAPTRAQRLTITMPTELASTIRQAVDDGDYASTSEAVREAVREWKVRRQLMLNEIAALKADIDQGLADVAAGRVKVLARGCTEENPEQEKRRKCNDKIKTILKKTRHPAHRVAAR
jgi:antitoxin ParD1/3/4